MQLEDAHALVIGISRYQRAPELRPTQDAQDVAAVLQDAACCGYPPAQVRSLLDGDATRAAILDALDALARDTREASTVFIYYSGHGARATGDGGPDTAYLVPVDAAVGSRDELERTALSAGELTARVRAIKAGRLTIVLDCCRAANAADLALGDALAPLSRGRGRALIAAARDSAFSLPGQRDSLMTGALVDGLRGAALGVAGVIRICDLFSYVQEHVAAAPLDQHPVFKAELEENYPIAQLHGGAAAPLVLPPAPADGAQYDAFVSYCETDTDDEAWVMTTLVPFLEGLGLVLCLEDRDFQLGASLVEEIDDAVLHSRYTVAVFSPAYVADAAEDYQSVLAAHRGMESHTPRMIPLIRKRCDLALHTRMTAALDITRATELQGALKRLALALRQPARPRLGG